MSLLYDVLYAHRCTSTHHKLALDALRQLRGDDAARWRNVFLKHGRRFLAGTKAPDDVFKDFRNHVLYVREKSWGGAVEAAESWYKKTVAALKGAQWAKAAYAAGVLSHYFSDPCMPLHTAQSEEAGIIHRACERSVFRSYDHLMSILEHDLGGYPEVKTSGGPRWLAELVKAGARLAHDHYEVLIDHYNPAKGRWRASSGLDDEIRVSLAECLGFAVVGFARILERAIQDAGVKPPKARIGLRGMFVQFHIPVMWWRRFRANAHDARIVRAIYREFRKTGKAIRALPEDERTVRLLHAEEVLKTNRETLDAIKPRAVGTKHGTGTYLRPMTAARAAEKPEGKGLPAQGAAPGAQTAGDRRTPAPLRGSAGSGLPAAAAPRPAKPVPRLAKFHLDPSSALADAPSIGHRTAEKLQAAGIRTVADLLARTPEDVAQRLKLGHIKPDTVRDWQIQSRLACRVPNLRALDVRILVACGIDQPEELAGCEALDLLDRVDLFISTSEGQRAVRGGSQPDLDVVTGWIESARHARTLRAA